MSSNARIVNGDLRKFCEQMGDILQWVKVTRTIYSRMASQESIGDFIEALELSRFITSTCSIGRVRDSQYKGIGAVLIFPSSRQQSIDNKYMVDTLISMVV